MKRNTIKTLGLILAMTQISTFANATTVSKLEMKAMDAASVLEHIVTIPDRGIPISLLEKASCVATVPGVLRIGYIFGARYGKGLVSCRVPGGWSRPSFVQIRGGSWGLQIGVQSVDLVLVFINANAVQKFSQNNLTVGLDATVAAGPVGRDAQIGTDYKLNSEIYSYSRARGLFAGLTIQGTSIAVDRKDNEVIYGDEITASQLLTSDGRSTPMTVYPYVRALELLAR